MGRVRVPQIVKANARQRLAVRQQLMPLVGNGSRLQRAAIRLGNDKCVIRQRNAEYEKLLGLLDAMPRSSFTTRADSATVRPFPLLGFL